MKKIANLYFFTGLILLIYIFFFFILQDCFQLKFSDFFTGLGAVGTVSSLLFIYAQILKTDEQFTLSNKPLLLPLNCQFIALQKPISIEQEFVLNKIVNSNFIFDNTLEIKCLKNEAVSIKLTILKGQTVESSQDYLAGDINTIISIPLPTEFVVKLSQVEPIDAGLSFGEAYKCLIYNLNYILRVNFQDINNNEYVDLYEIQIEAGMKAFDIIHTVASINFKKISITK